jgi:hypothetical protein
MPAATRSITIHRPIDAVFAFVADGPTGEFRFEELGTETRLTFSLEAELGGWKRLLMSGPVQQTMDAEMAALDRLKELLEV